MVRRGSKEKLGILGTSATGLKDIRPTPVEDRMPGVEIHANLIDTVISAILYYTSSKSADTVYQKALKNGKSENEALVEKNKVKINGAPFLKSGANMKFIEAMFTILLAFYNNFSLKIWPDCKYFFTCGSNWFRILHECQIFP